MPASQRDPLYKLQSYPEYLKSRGLIKNNGFTLYKNFKGGNSVLNVGLIDQKMHFNNYSLIEIPDRNMSLYAFNALDVMVSNFSFQGTHGVNKWVSTIVDNHFPHVLMQTTEPLAGEYFKGNLTAGMEGI